MDDQSQTLAPVAVNETRRFVMTDQIDFASWSGDVNPMHMDELAARRMQAGRPVVHGMHALLWVLDRLTAAGLPLAYLKHMRVQFGKFIAVGLPVELRFRQEHWDKARVTVSCDGLVVISMLLRLEGAAARLSAMTPRTETVPARPEELTFAQMREARGRLLPPIAPDRIAAAFPHLAEAVGPRRVSALAQLSRLVGMDCPGLHSIFAGLSLELTAAEHEDGAVQFRVIEVDERFRVVNLAVEGEGLTGTVSAFARRAPVMPPPMSELARHVEPSRFKGQRILVVGGSRGLGAVTAKILAVGGGEVTITYARGRDDAEQVADAIRATPGAPPCSVAHLDVMQPIQPQLSNIGARFTHLYYFATPPIFVQKAQILVPDLHTAFNRAYVLAFHELCMSLLPDPLSVFYPSSIAVVSRPDGMTEYSMAKMAGEILCADLMQAYGRLKILVERLPRVLTDQTATVAQVENADPVDVMLPLILRTQAMTQAVAA